MQVNRAVIVLLRRGEKFLVSKRTKRVKWAGEPRNMEPEKCSELRWVTASELPSNIITHSVPTIQNIDRAPLYIVSQGDEVVA